MNSWRKYEARFEKTENQLLDDLGIDVDDDYDVEITRVNLDDVSSYNPHHLEGYVTLRFKSSECFVVKVDIQELDDYFFK